MPRSPRGRGSVFYSQGRWVAQRKIDGKLHRRVRRTQPEALEALDELRDRERKGLALDAPITLGKHIDEWLDTLDVRPHTKAGYASKLNLVPPRLRQVRLDRLRPAQLRKLFEELRATQSPQSVAHVRSVLRNCLRRAVQDGLIERNPASLTDAVKVPNVERRTLSYAEAVKFLESVRGERLEALFVLALYVGLRQSELLGLRWSDVDAAGMPPGRRGTPFREDSQLSDAGVAAHTSSAILHVRQTLHRVEGAIVVTPPKTKRSERTIPLPPEAVAALQRHRASVDVIPLSNLVFTTPAGKPLNSSTVRRTLYRHLDALEIERVTFHDLRGAAASILHAQGFTPREVMAVLGHSSYITSMNLYVHADQEELANKMGAVDWRAQ